MNRTMNPNLYEVSFTGIAAVLTFLTTLFQQPIKLILASVSKIDGKIHLIIDGTGISTSALGEIGAKMIDKPYLKVGYTPLLFTGQDPVTKLYLVGSITAALTNKYYTAFRDGLVGAVIDTHGKIVNDAIQHNVLVALGIETDRILEASLDGTSWIKVPLAFKAESVPSQFGFAQGVITQGVIGETEIYGLPLAKLVNVFEDGLDITTIQESWTKVADLTSPLAFISRAWDNGGLLVGTADQTQEGYRLYIDDGKVTMFSEVTEAQAKLPDGYNGIIGAYDDGYAVVKGFDDKSGLRLVEFVDKTWLPEPVRQLIEQMTALQAQPQAT